MNKTKQTRLALLLTVAILIVDQVVKILVKTNMQIGEEFNVIGSWFRIHFTENNGFAFGMSMGGDVGKIVLTTFRIVASAALVWFLNRMIKKGARTPVVVYTSLIIAGALGNVIDSLFYGIIFNESYFQVATLFPPEGGYAPLMLGRVVDMFYIPLFELTWPQWLPFVGGQHFEFFNAIFNVADSAITIGVVWFAVDQIFIQAKSSKSETTDAGQEK